MDLDFVSFLVGAIMSAIAFIVNIVINFITERKRIKNERGTHINQARFDKEFEIYQELSEKNLSAVYNVGEALLVIKYNDSFDNTDKDDLLEKFCKNLNDAEFSNKKYAPFINKEIFEKYKALEKKVSFCFTLYKFWVKHHSDTLKFEDKEYKLGEIEEVFVDMQKEISSLSDTILDELRGYLGKLDIIR